MASNKTMVAVHDVVTIRLYSIVETKYKQCFEQGPKVWDEMYTSLGNAAKAILEAEVYEGNADEDDVEIHGNVVFIFPNEPSHVKKFTVTEHKVKIVI